MDILEWLLRAAVFLAGVAIFYFVLYKIIDLYNFLSERFFAKIEEGNLGKVIFMQAKYLLISCSVLFYTSAIGFLILIVDCSAQNGAFSTIIWDCTKLDLAQRGNLTLVSYVPLFLLIIFIIGLLISLIRKNSFLVAAEIGIYSLIFIVTLPIGLLIILFPHFWKFLNEAAEVYNKRKEKDDEIRRQARIAHDAVNKKERGYWD